MSCKAAVPRRASSSNSSSSQRPEPQPVAAAPGSTLSPLAPPPAPHARHHGPRGSAAPLELGFADAADFHVSDEELLQVQHTDGRVALLAQHWGSSTPEGSPVDALVNGGSSNASMDEVRAQLARQLSLGDELSEDAHQWESTEADAQLGLPPLDTLHPPTDTAVHNHLLQQLQGGHSQLGEDGDAHMQPESAAAAPVSRKQASTPKSSKSLRSSTPAAAAPAPPPSVARAPASSKPKSRGASSTAAAAAAAAAAAGPAPAADGIGEAGASQNNLSRIRSLVQVGPQPVCVCVCVCACVRACVRA